MPERWALIVLIGAALFGTGFIKGCQAERDKWELASAVAEKEAAGETHRRIQAQAELVKQSREREAKAISDRNRADLAVRLLRQTIEDRGRNTPVAQGGAADVEAGKLLGDCAERYRWLAGEADKANIAGSLCTSIFDSLTNRQKVKSFILESK